MKPWQWIALAIVAWYLASQVCVSCAKQGAAYGEKKARDDFWW